MTVNVASAVTPWVAPVTCLVTLNLPKTGIVGLVTVSVAVPPAVIAAVGAGDQVGVPQTKAGDEQGRPLAAAPGPCTCFPAGRPGIVTLPPLAIVTVPMKPPPQS